MARKTSKLTPHQIEEKERIARAVALRRQGLSFQMIADSLGYNSRNGAYRAIHAHIIALGKADVEYMRETEADRLDTALLAIWPAVRNADLDAIGVMLKIMERRAKFFGLDAPTKVPPVSPQGDEAYKSLSVEEAVARFTVLIGESVPLPPLYATEEERVAASL